MKLRILLFTAFTMLFSSCNKETPDPIIPNEEELISTMIYTLIDTLNNDTVILSFQDLDGDGGNPPIITSGVLTLNTSYIGSLQLLNETVSPTIDIGAEVEAEAEEHQFFYLIENNLDAAVSYTDFDANGYPVGLNTFFIADAASMGLLTIILRHEPDKTAPGVSDGDILNAGGETDIQVSFQISIL